MIKAAALIAVPILFAALYLQLQLRGQAPGVYVEVDSRGNSGGRTYALSGYTIGAFPAHPDVTMNTLTVNGRVRSFFIVDPDQSVAVSASSTKLYVFVVNSADEAFRSELMPLALTIHRVNPRVYRVVASAELGPDGPGLQYYRHVLARAAGSRATMELMMGLVIQDSNGRRRMYSVSSGPVR